MKNNYYQIGLTLNPYSLATKIHERIKKEIREQAAQGAAPAAKKAVSPMVIGVGAVSVLALAIALRK